jgi:hypothetical protein
MSNLVKYGLAPRDVKHFSQLFDGESNLKRASPADDVDVFDSASSLNRILNIIWYFTSVD